LLLCSPVTTSPRWLTNCCCYSFWTFSWGPPGGWIWIWISNFWQIQNLVFKKNIQQCSLFPYFGFMILSYQRSCGSNGKIKDMLTLIKKSLLLVANHLIIYFIYLFILYRNNYIIIKINLVVVIVNCKKRPLKG
jgi:hypothetical protein